MQKNNLNDDYIFDSLEETQGEKPEGKKSNPRVTDKIRAVLSSAGEKFNSTVIERLKGVEPKKLIIACACAAAAAAVIIIAAFAAKNAGVKSEVKDYIFLDHFYKTSSCSVEYSPHLKKETRAAVAANLGDTENRGVIKVKGIYLVTGKYGKYVGLNDIPEENSLKGSYYICTVTKYTLRGEERFAVSWILDCASKDDLDDYIKRAKETYKADQSTMY